MQVDKDTPIVFPKDLYNYIDIKANEKNMTIKEYANKLLTMNLKRYAYLEKNYPNFKIGHISIEDRYFIVGDTSKEEPEIFVLKLKKNDEIECDKDKSKDCNHVKFTKMCPEYSYVLYPNDLRVDKQM